MRVTQTQFLLFDRQYANGVYAGQRYGEAFLRAFNLYDRKLWDIRSAVIARHDIQDRYVEHPAETPAMEPPPF